jgi:hypothetical protein
MTTKEQTILSSIANHEPISIDGVYNPFPHWGWLEIETIIDRLFDYGWLRYNGSGNVIINKSMYEQQSLSFGS